MTTTTDTKQMNELHEGPCTVIARCGEQEKHFKGHFAADLQVVFFAMPDRFEVVGYIQ